MHEVMEIDALLTDLGEQTNAALARWAAGSDVPAELTEAMRYAVLGDGKRVRPALVMLSARAAAGDATPAGDPLAAAVAIELVHCYSLVHDDLPAMDDDAIRRGRATVHVKFGEAMGILVGDALLTRAFAVLAEHAGPPAIAAGLMAELARAAGPAGMIAGQVADMGLCDLADGRDGLEYIHARKTGSLFAAATRMGGICAEAPAEAIEALGAFGVDLGLAYQVTDDLLDATATSDQLGKAAGKDAAAGKRTYPALLGLEGTAAAAAELSRRAPEHLAILGPPAEPLRQLAAWMLARRR